MDEEVPNQEAEEDFGASNPSPTPNGLPSLRAYLRSAFPDEAPERLEVMARRYGPDPERPCTACDGYYARANGEPLCPACHELIVAKPTPFIPHRVLMTDAKGAEVELCVMTRLEDGSLVLDGSANPEQGQSQRGDASSSRIPPQPNLACPGQLRLNSVAISLDALRAMEAGEEIQDWNLASLRLPAQIAPLAVYDPAVGAGRLEEGWLEEKVERGRFF